MSQGAAGGGGGLLLGRTAAGPNMQTFEASKKHIYAEGVPVYTQAAVDSEQEVGAT